MEAKDKAIALVKKFYVDALVDISVAKICALILVDETFKELSTIWCDYDNVEDPIDERVIYWENVKNEIEKL